VGKEDVPLEVDFTMTESDRVLELELILVGKGHSSPKQNVPLWLCRVQRGTSAPHYVVLPMDVGTRVNPDLALAKLAALYPNTGKSPVELFTSIFRVVDAKKDCQGTALTDSGIVIVYGSAKKAKSAKNALHPFMSQVSDAIAVCESGNFTSMFAIEKTVSLDISMSSVPKAGSKRPREDPALPKFTKALRTTVSDNIAIIKEVLGEEYLADAYELQKAILASTAQHTDGSDSDVVAPPVRSAVKTHRAAAKPDTPASHGDSEEGNDEDYIPSSSKRLEKSPKPTNSRKQLELPPNSASKSITKQAGVAKSVATPGAMQRNEHAVLQAIRQVLHNPTFTPADAATKTDGHSSLLSTSSWDPARIDLSRAKFVADSRPTLATGSAVLGVLYLAASDLPLCCPHCTKPINGEATGKKK
jgi:hypothetical protein